MPLAHQVERQYRELSQKPDSIFGQTLFFLTSFLQSAIEKCFPESCSEVTFRAITNIKDVEKVKEKVDRSTRRVVKFHPGQTIDSLDHLIEEINDLVRGRVIVDYVTQAELIVTYIKGAADGRWPISDELRCLRFPQDNGYRAYHLTLKVGTPYGPCFTEIQIQTTNQFSWASKTHPLLYKPSVPPPPPLGAMMKHLSDCLHINDLLFEEIHGYIESIDKRSK